MTYETLLVEQRNHVTYVTLNRPTALNALNTSLRRDLKQLFTGIQADPEVRVVVITGAGRAFCAGADIKEWREPISVVEDREDRLRLNFWQAMSRCEAPVIAAINGYALGGGADYGRSDGRCQGFQGKTPTTVQGTIIHPLPGNWRTPWTR